MPKSSRWSCGPAADRESLIEFLLPDGSPERLQFELLFRSQQIIVLEQSVTAARRAMFTDAARGNGNGQIPKLR